MFDAETIEALTTLRLAVRTGLDIDAAPREAFEQLNKAGVFAALDEQVETAKAEKLLIESAAGDIAEQHGARDHETRDPITYLRTVRAAQVKSLSEAPFAQKQQTHVVDDDEDLTVSGRVIDVLRDAREIYTTPGKEQSEGWWDGAVDYVLTGEGRDESSSEK